MSKPIFQEFKNALHISKVSINTNHNLLQQFKHQRSTKTISNQGHGTHFGLSTFSQQFKQIQHKQSKFKQCIEGIGVTIDDMGHLIIAQWRNNQIDGRYFLYKPNHLEQNDQNYGYSALCQYGHMKSGILHGDNYVYNSFGTLAKAQFSSNKIIGKSYIIHSNKLFVTNQINEMNTIECQIVNFSKDDAQFTKNNLLKMPPVNSISSILPTNKLNHHFEKINSNLFIKPNQFIQCIINQNQGKDKDGEILTYISISQRDYFIGFLQVDHKKPKVQPLKKMRKNNINGFGAIFKNQWPASYGTYKSGELEGLGRIYESQMNFFDGFFAKGQLMQGFIVDSHHKTISFGHHSSLDSQYQVAKQDFFVITNTFQTGSLDCIIEYRRNFHLKSLNFNNSYFNAPKIVHRSPWPYNILDRLSKKTQIGSIIKSFHPTLRDVEISYIQKINQNSDNRVEKQLLDYIKQTDSNAKPGDRIKTEIKQQVKRQFYYKVKQQEKVRNYEQNQIKVKQKNNHISDYSNQKKFNNQLYSIQEKNPFKKARKPYVRQFRQQQRDRTYSKEASQNQSQNQPQNKSHNKPQNKPQKRKIGSISKMPNGQSQTKNNKMHVQNSIKKVQIPIKKAQSPIKHIQNSIKHVQSQAKNTLRSQVRHRQSSIKHKISSTHSQINKNYQDKIKNIKIKMNKNDLTDLINEYHECQTERKKTSISGNTTKRNTERNISPREVTTQRQSARQAVKYPNNRRKVDLDLVYREYLRK